MKVISDVEMGRDYRDVDRIVADRGVSSAPRVSLIKKIPVCHLKKA